MMDTQFNSVGRDAMLKLLHDAPDGGEVLLKVTGKSMMPFLFHNRSMVFLKKDASYVAKKGDIVLFRRLDGTLVLHRIRKIQKNGVLVINGDAQSWTERILPTQILAHVTHFVRRKRDVSVDALGYRFLVALWMPLRPIHPLGARLVQIWHRIPQKLFPKRINRT